MMTTLPSNSIVISSSNSNCISNSITNNSDNNESCRGTCPQDNIDDNMPHSDETRNSSLTLALPSNAIARRNSNGFVSSSDVMPSSLISSDDHHRPHIDNENHSNNVATCCIHDPITDGNNCNDGSIREASDSHTNSNSTDKSDDDHDRNDDNSSDDDDDSDSNIDSTDTNNDDDNDDSDDDCKLPYDNKTIFIGDLPKSLTTSNGDLTPLLQLLTISIQSSIVGYKHQEATSEALRILRQIALTSNIFSGFRSNYAKKNKSLHVSNLDLSVDYEDLKKLFSDLGAMSISNPRIDHTGETCFADIKFQTRALASLAKAKVNHIVFKGGKHVKLEWFRNCNYSMIHNNDLLPAGETQIQNHLTVTSDLLTNPSYSQAAMSKEVHRTRSTLATNVGTTFEAGVKRENMGTSSSMSQHADIRSVQSTTFDHNRRDLSANLTNGIADEACMASEELVIDAKSDGSAGGKYQSRVHRYRNPANSNVVSLFVQFETVMEKARVDESVIRAVFGMFGQVVGCYIKCDYTSSSGDRQYGYAFLHYEANSAGFDSARLAIRTVGNSIHRSDSSDPSYAYNGVSYRCEPSKNCKRAMSLFTGNYCDNLATVEKEDTQSSKRLNSQNSRHFLASRNHSRRSTNRLPVAESKVCSSVNSTEAENDVTIPGYNNESCHNEHSNGHQSMQQQMYPYYPYQLSYSYLPGQQQMDAYGVVVNPMPDYQYSPEKENDFSDRSAYAQPSYNGDIIRYNQAMFGTAARAIQVNPYSFPAYQAQYAHPLVYYSADGMLISCPPTYGNQTAVPQRHLSMPMLPQMQSPVQSTRVQAINTDVSNHLSGSSTGELNSAENYQSLTSPYISVPYPGQWNALGYHQQQQQCQYLPMQMFSPIAQPMGIPISPLHSLQTSSSDTYPFHCGTQFSPNGVNACEFSESAAVDCGTRCPPGTPAMQSPGNMPSPPTQIAHVGTMQYYAIQPFDGSAVVPHDGVGYVYATPTANQHWNKYISVPGTHQSHSPQNSSSNNQVIIARANRQSSPQGTQCQKDPMSNDNTAESSSV